MLSQQTRCENNDTKTATEKKTAKAPRETSGYIEAPRETSGYIEAPPETSGYIDSITITRFL
jgi:hypothetical protein